MENMIWQEKSLELDSKKIHYYYKVDNKKKNLIFLHGFMDNGLCYDRVAEQFLPEYNVYLMDARGHGLTSDPITYNYNELLEDVQDLCHANNISHVVLFGHSMGGLEAAMFASRNPNLVKALIMEDPGFGPKYGKIMSNFLGFVLSIFFPHKKTPADLSAYIKRSKKWNSKWQERDQLVWARAQREFSTHYPGKNLKILFTGDSPEELMPKIKIPMLLFTSEHGMNSRKKAEKMQSFSPLLQWKYVEKAGHNIRREQFDLLIQTSKDFLQNLN